MTKYMVALCETTPLQYHYDCTSSNERWAFIEVEAEDERSAIKLAMYEHSKRRTSDET